MSKRHVKEGHYKRTEYDCALLAGGSDIRVQALYKFCRPILEMTVQESTDT